MSGSGSEEAPLLPRRESFVRFKRYDTNNGEANIQQVAHDVYDALVDDTIEDEDLDEDALWLREQRDLNKTLHWLKRPSLFMIGIAIFLFSFASITGESSRQILTFKLACNSLIRDSDKGFCDPASAEVILSNLKAAYTVSTSLIALIAMTRVGQLSDQYGRKIFICLIAITILSSRIFQYFLMTHYNYLRFGWMIFLESILSLTGGLMTFVSLFNCYVADISDAHERSYYLGVGMAFFFTGISLGPIASNLVRALSKILRSSGPSKFALSSVEKPFNVIEDYEWDPLRFEIFCLFILIMFIIFVLPESRPEKSRRKSRSLSVSQISELRNQDRQPLSIAERLKTLPHSLSASFLAFFQPLKLLLIPKEFKPANFSDSRFRRERMAVILLVALDSFLTAFAAGTGEIYILYGILKLHWNSTDIGYFLAIGCAARAIVLVCISPLVNHYLFHKWLRFKVMKTQLDMPDFVNILIAFVTECIVMATFPFIKSTGAFFVVVCFSSLGSLATPSINSALVKYYPDAKTGALFSGLSVVKNLCVLTIPVLLLALYNMSITKLNFPGFVFLCFSLMFFIMILLLLVVKVLLGLHSKSEQEALTRSNSFLRGRRSSSLSQEQERTFININTPEFNANKFESSAGKDSTDPLSRINSFDSSNGKPSRSIGELHRKNSNISQYRSKP